MFAISALLILTAAYCGGAWLWLSWKGFENGARFSYDQHVEIERQTFHLGLCFILALGLLGLIWK